MEDYDLVAAPSGTAALALLEERSVALVITDQKMPAHLPDDRPPFGQLADVLAPRIT
jgi:CheY-like chemotaxis protein